MFRDFTTSQQYATYGRRRLSTRPLGFALNRRALVWCRLYSIDLTIYMHNKTSVYTPEVLGWKY